MVAFSNHGKSENPRKTSRSSINNQMPFVETLVTSAPEVGVPRRADFIVVLASEPQRCGKARCGQTVILRDLQLWIEP